MPFKNPHPLYKVWNSMRQRCRNPRNRAWKDYGGRGITICERWDSFAAFVADMGARPDGYFIDRTDNNGHYEPRNCRWTTRRENQLNRRITLWAIIEGRRHRVADLAVQSGLKPDTIKARIANGLPLAEVIAPERRVFIEGLALGGLANGARQRAKTHCNYGHAFDAAHTYDGPRFCRECKRIKAARYRAEGRWHYCKTSRA